MDPDIPLTAVQPLQDYVDGDLAGNRAMGVVLAVFGTVALGLAGVGILGLVSYTVAQRTRAIGIRMALGADARLVLGWILRVGLTLTAAGVGLGIGAAMALTRLMRTLLFQVSPLDPMLYGALALTLLALAGIASWVPARRATRIDPAAALKQDA